MKKTAIVASSLLLSVLALKFGCCNYRRNTMQQDDILKQKIEILSEFNHNDHIRKNREDQLTILNSALVSGKPLEPILIDASDCPPGLGPFRVLGFPTLIVPVS
jgi:hypothetical protein